MLIMSTFAAAMRHFLFSFPTLANQPTLAFTNVD